LGCERADEQHRGLVWEPAVGGVRLREREQAFVQHGESRWSDSPVQAELICRVLARSDQVAARPCQPRVGDLVQLANAGMMPARVGDRRGVVDNYDPGVGCPVEEDVKRIQKKPDATRTAAAECEPGKSAGPV